MQFGLIYCISQKKYYPENNLKRNHQLLYFFSNHKMKNGVLCAETAHINRGQDTI